jgi:hypothetical protein
MKYSATIVLTTYAEASSEDLAKEQITSEWFKHLYESSLDWWIETESIKQISEIEWRNNGLE